MARQIINIGTNPNDGSGDTIRDSFDKVNDNFAEVYANIVALSDGNVTTDIKGNVFGEDSTLLVDAINSVIPWSVIDGAPTIPTGISQLTGDYKGSVFGDDSTLLVDGVNGKIVGPVETTSIISSGPASVSSIGADIYAARTVGSFINLGTNASSVNVVTNIDMLNNTINNATVSGYISIADLQTLVASSVDFTDFQARIAAL